MKSSDIKKHLSLRRLLACILFAGINSFYLYGCAATSYTDARMERFVPVHSERPAGAIPLYAHTETVTDTNGVAEMPAVSNAVFEVAAADSTALSSDISEGRPEVTQQQEDVTEFSTPFSVLKRGDRVNVFLRGIPEPEDISDIVDENGNIKLGLVGSVNVSGLTTAQAETAIEQAYMDGGFYNRIDVIIVSQSDNYFVRGEVQRPGRYPLSGDMTLIQAISTAGGYTDYARQSRVNIIRDGKSHRYNASRIEEQRDPDPAIKPGDIIVVDRRVFF